MIIIPVAYIGVQPSSGRGLWMFTEDWTYDGYTIPKGFITDGGSIPRVFWFFLNPAGAGMPAYCVHDYLYTTHTTSREEADKILRDLLEKRGLGTFHSTCAYLAVRAFGGGKTSWDAPNPTLEEAV